MRTSRIGFAFALALVVAAGVWATEKGDKPHIVILATGGTIAGYAE